MTTKAYANELVKKFNVTVHDRKKDVVCEWFKVEGNDGIATCTRYLNGKGNCWRVDSLTDSIKGVSLADAIAYAVEFTTK